VGRAFLIAYDPQPFDIGDRDVQATIAVGRNVQMQLIAFTAHYDLEVGIRHMFPKRSHEIVDDICERSVVKVHVLSLELNIFFDHHGLRCYS